MNQFSFFSNHPSPNRRAKTLLLLLLVFVTIRLDAQSTTTYFEDWVQSGGSGPTQVQNELLEKIATTLDGSSNLFVASTTFNDVTEVYDLLLQKFNSGGTLIWSTQYNITSGGNVLVGDLILDSSGNPIFTGSVDNGANSYDALTMKFSTSGSVTWSHTWNDTADGYDGGTSVVVDGSDNVYITGVSTASAVASDFLTIKYTSGGTETWVSEYDHAGYIDIASKILYSSGYIQCIGAVQVSGGEWAMARMLYGASSGVSTGSATILSSSVVFDEINGFTSINDYTYIVGAVKNGANGYDFLTVKVDPSLNVAWTVTWDGTSGKDVANAVAVDGSGNVYVTGYTTTATHGPDYATVKYNSSGTLQWAETYDGAKHGTDQGTDVEVDGNGDVFVTGFAKEEGDEDYVTLWYDGSGTELWSGRFNSVYNRKDKAVDLELDMDGNIFVTGRTVKIDTALVATTETTTVKYRKADLLIPPDEEEQSNSLYYVKNNGQLLGTDGEPVREVKFYSETTMPMMYFSDDYFSLVLSQIDEDTSILDTMLRIDVTFWGKGAGNTVLALDEKEDYHNYYYGHIPEGREQVPLSKRVVHSNAFEGIDVHYTSNNAGIKYDFVVKPFADPNNIKLVISGHDNLTVGLDGELIIGTSLGDIIFPVPIAYEIEDNEESELEWVPAYSIAGDTVKFVTDAYNDDLPLVIRIKETPREIPPMEDECLLWSTYYGRGIDNTEKFNGLATDENSISAIGSTPNSDFPVETGAIVAFKSKEEVTLLNFNLVGKTQWGTFIGGTGYDRPNGGVKSDGAGSLYFTGYTDSDNLPVVATGSAHIESFYPSDMSFIGRVNSAGVLKWLTYFARPCSSIDGSSGTSLAITPEKNVIVVGSYVLPVVPNGCTYPVINGGGGEYENYGGTAYIAEFSSSNQLLWATRFGESCTSPSCVDVDDNNNIFVVGTTCTNGTFPFEFRVCFEIQKRIFEKLTIG